MKEQDTPTRGIWRRFLVLIPLVVVMVLASRAYIAGKMSTYEMYGFGVHEVGTLTADDLSVSKEGVVEVITFDQTSRGFPHIVVRAVADGETTLRVNPPEAKDVWSLKVTNGAIIEGGANFSGWESIHVCICIFLAVATALFASVLVRLWRNAWYGYTMVASGGGFVFCAFQLLLFTYMLCRGSLVSFSNLATEVSFSADWFSMMARIPLALMALLVSASNISLIRHEGFRPVNVLGIVVSVFWIVANYVWDASYMLVYGLFGSWAAAEIVGALLAVAITYGECLLFSTIMCAWLASRHVPRHGADYVAILGCGLRDDGTPCPLLAGRVDRALAYVEQRVAAGDKPATFVPSGGQGPDEIMSEAQSMGDYLAQKGVPRERIVLEDRSATTRENMAFTREVIERHAGCDVSERSVVFSTTNYHVFRGYVCAHLAGMRVEGVGSKTRAYFWPNAFLREFAGLLVSQRWMIAGVYVVLAVIYVLAVYVLTLT